MPHNNAAEYYNSCSSDYCASVPHNCAPLDSYQEARTGVGYIGIFLLNGLGGNRRNYYQVQLADSLRKGKCYYVEFFVSLSNAVKYASANVSMLFTNTAVYVDTIATPFGVLPANSQIVNYGNPIITDTLNWKKVSGVIVAQGGEQFITLGNFKYDNQTNYSQVQATGYSGAGYYIDDVSVIPLDSMPLKADAGRDTTIKLGDSVFIGSLTNGLTGVVWYNSLGLPISNGIPGFYVTPLLSTFYVIEQTVCGYYSRDTVWVNVNPLPVTIVNYALRQAQGDNRQAQDDRVVNYWTTATEINVSHFNVQRSVNGKDFITIGKVAANNKPSEYSYRDEAPLAFGEGSGVRYYRLEILDKDGTKTYSTIQHINLSIHQELSISPNPARDKITVSAKNIQEIRIINSMGQVALRQAQGDNGMKNYTLNIQQLTKGLYLVQVITRDGEMKTGKLVVD